jgi:hypothetical protein
MCSVMLPSAADLRLGNIGDADEIRLVAPMTAVHELDKLKNDEKERRAKARR